MEEIKVLLNESSGLFEIDTPVNPSQDILRRSFEQQA